MKPAGFENGQGVLSAHYAKDAACAMEERSRMKNFSLSWTNIIPDADPSNSQVIYGYGAAQTLTNILEMCGDDLTRLTS